MIGHDGIGADIDGEDLGQVQEFVFYPTSAVFKRLAGVCIKATQESAADATRNSMVIRCGCE